MNDDVSLGSSIPFSGKTEVLLSPVGGGCGREIPNLKDDGRKSLGHGKLWCGMESLAMPGLYFVCPECLSGRD